MPSDALLAILAMAIATYATRSGGLWLMSRLPPSTWLEASLRHLPGALLISLVAPLALHDGLAGVLAGAVVAFVARRTGQILPALVVGVVLVALLRALLQ
jgi:branched chain amino acid efflux pump